jgi:hypothetical protein
MTKKQPLTIKREILTFYDQSVKAGEGWVEQEFVLLIIAGLPNGTGLPNE